MASVAAVQSDFWAHNRRLAGAKMHILLHQGHRHLSGGSVWRLLDHIFTHGPQAENPHRFSDCDRLVFCVPLGGM